MDFRTFDYSLDLKCDQPFCGEAILPIYIILYVIIDFAGLERLVIYRYALLAETRLSFHIRRFS